MIKYGTILNPIVLSADESKKIRNGNCNVYLDHTLYNTALHTALQ